MKLNINFLQTGGVPLTNDLMSNIMEAIQLYDVLGDVAGNLTILSGGDPVSGSVNTVNPGIVVIDGEVLPFEGGAIAANVFIHESTQNETFEDQTSKVLIRRRSVKFGNSFPPNQYSWTDFVRLQTLKGIQESLDQKANQSQVDNHETRLQRLELKTAPIENGGVAFIFRRPASEVPPGWKECTDLRRKTIFGYDPTGGSSWSTLNHEGGAETVSILKDNLPAIKLKTSILQPYGSNSGNGGFDGGSNQWNWKMLETENLGTSAPLNILNPYRLVNFIEPNFQ